MPTQPLRNSTRRGAARPWRAPQPGRAANPPGRYTHPIIPQTALPLTPSRPSYHIPTMQSWRNFSAQLPAVDVSGFSKNLRNTVQATRCVHLPFALPTLSDLRGCATPRDGGARLGQKGQSSGGSDTCVMEIMSNLVPRLHPLSAPHGRFPVSTLSRTAADRQRTSRQRRPRRYHRVRLAF